MALSYLDSAGFVGRIFIMLKKYASLAILLFQLILISGTAWAKEVRVVTSFYPLYIMAKNVTRDVPGLTLNNFTPPLTGCLHDYTVTADDMKKLSDADLFIASGGGMESFLDKIVARFPDLKVVVLSEGLQLIKEGQGINPHIWVSISGAMQQVSALGEALEEFDPEHKLLYAKNTADYLARLENLRQKMHAQLAPYKGRDMITFHRAFTYFAAEFGFNVAAVVEREPGSSPSAKEIAATVELIRSKGMMPLFVEPQYPAAAAESIARETGAKIYMLDPAVTGPDDSDAYIKIMEKNMDVLKKAFS